MRLTEVIYKYIYFVYINLKGANVSYFTRVISIKNITFGKNLKISNNVTLDAKNGTIILSDNCQIWEFSRLQTCYGGKI